MKQNVAVRRRQILLVGAAVAFQAVTAGCTRAKSTIGEIRRAAWRSAPTPQELELLRNIKVRRTALGNKQLVIAGRLFGAETRLEDFELENTLFKDCDFEGCTMLRGVLRYVSFDNCLFVANVWEKGPWDNVSFSGCAWRGRFKMGTAALKGDLRFDDCEFIGSTAEEMGYGGPADTFGSVGANDGNVFYKNCQFAHTYINGGALLNIKSSVLNDCKLQAARGARLLVEDVTGSGLIDVEGGRDVVFSSVVVRDSKFSGALSFEDVQIGSGTFERLTADLTLEASRADTIDMRNVTFFSKDGANPGYRTGLDTRSAKIRILSILDCDFRGPTATLCLGGTAEYRLDQKDADGNDVYTTEMATAIDKLTIRRTNLIGARLDYMKVGEWRLEELAIKNADFSNSKIDVLSLRQVTMDGKVEFADTVIAHKKSEAVTDRSTGTPPSVGE